MEFQSWKVNFKTDVCTKTADSHLAMHWIKEVEIAKSINEFLTSRSIVERTDFLDYDMLEAMIASALKRLVDKHIHFRKRVSVEEQRAQKIRSVLERKTNCLHGSTSISVQTERIVQVKITRLCSASDRLGVVRSRNRSQ